VCTLVKLMVIYRSLTGEVYVVTVQVPDRTTITSGVHMMDPSKSSLAKGKNRVPMAAGTYKVWQDKLDKASAVWTKHTVLKDLTKQHILDIYNLLPASVQTKARTEIDGRLAPRVFTTYIGSVSFYHPFVHGTSGSDVFRWVDPYFTYSVLYGSIADPSTVAHEVGHYMSHVLLGDNGFYELSQQAIRNHDIGTPHEGRPMLEEYAMFSDYSIYGKVKHGFVMEEPYETLNGSLPQSVDWPSKEGYATCLLARLHTTKNTIITKLPDETQDIPLVGASLTDLWGILANGPRNVNALRLEIGAYLNTKTMLDKLPAILERTGWTYHGSGKVVNGQKSPVANVKVQAISKVGSEKKEYVGSQTKVITDKDGNFALDHIFPGSNFIRVWASDVDSMDFPLTVDPNSKTNTSFAIGELVFTKAVTFTIIPASLQGSKDSVYKWFISPSIPSTNYKYEWNFGDGTSLYSSSGDTNAWHTYAKAGNFTITTTVYDRSSNTKIGEATATATIGSFEITSVVPDKVSYGMPVTVTGTSFGAVQGTSTITFSNLPADDIISWSDTKIVATIPEAMDGMGATKVTVGGKESNVKYISKKYPKINSTNKSHAKPYEVIEIRGEYFGYKQGTATIYFRYENTLFTIMTWSDTLITAIVPDVEVQNWSYGKGTIYLSRPNWGMTSIDFILDEDVLATLHRTNSWAALTFGGRQLIYLSNPTPHEEYQGYFMHLYNKDWNHTKEIIWTGTSFTFTFSKTDATSSENITLSGTMSDDGTIIKTIHGKYELIYDYQSSTQSYLYEYDFKDIPLFESGPSSLWVDFKVTGPSVKDHIVSAVWREERQGVLDEEYRGTDWTSTVTLPEISFRFQKQ